jgi:hypothetical protein
MMISLKTILILLLLAFLAGLLILTPLVQWLQGVFNGISQATAPVANAINATSDNSLCQHAGIGC